MNCYITWQTIDGQQVEVRNFIGNATITITSPDNAAHYIPPPCIDAPPADLPVVHTYVAAPLPASSSVPEPGTLALFVLGAVLLSCFSRRAIRS